MAQSFPVERPIGVRHADPFFEIEQATELDRAKREAILHRIQRLIHEKVMYAPLMEPAILAGYGPRVAESAIGLITNMAGSTPYEELRLKGK